MLDNGNVFLIDSAGPNNPPKVFSSFQKAEGELLTQIRAKGPCGFGCSITCIQVDSNQVRKIDYWGSVRIEAGFKHITIKRDKDNRNGCKKTHRERIRINLDY